jgi:peptidoglycan-associated lipoprotein
MAKLLGVVVSLVIGLALLTAPAAPAEAFDEIVLFNGAHVTGDLQEREYALTTPMGSHRLTRANAWRLVLATAVGDSVDFRNGSRISGQVEQATYTLRMAGGQTRVYDRGEVAIVTLGADRQRFDTRPDVLVLDNGDHIYGEIVGGDFDLALPTGSQRVGRDSMWRMVLNTPVGDTLEFLNGDRLTGRLDVPTLAIRTRDGQTETYGRNDVLVVGFRVPEPIRRAALPGGPGTGGAAALVPPAASAPGPTVPPAALPPAVRAVLRDLHFEYDRWELSPEARATLEEVAAAMKAFPGLNLLIEGHADERGTPEYNLALGAKRAQTARDYLVNLGVEATRLDMVSYGEERPLDATHTEMAWALNRRAHFAVKAQ